MEQLGLYLHSIRKRQIKNTMTKIDRRTYVQMKKMRSQGLEIANDYSNQLKRAVRRSKTEKLTFMQRKDERRRLMTQYKISGPSEEVKEQGQINIYKIDEQIIESNQPQNQTEDQEDSVLKDKVVSSKMVSCNKIPTGSILREQQNSSQKLFQKPSLIEISQGSFQSPKPIKKKFLPMLQLYIKQQECLKEMNAQQKQIRNLIVTMMVLAINRRNNDRLFDALDILIQTQIYFPKESREMIHLKSVWIELIGKIYEEIRKTLKPRKESNRWKPTLRRSSAKLTLQLKQRKTIFIRSLVSRKAFFEKCSQNLRKSKLIFESTYFDELRNEQNIIKKDHMGNKLVCRMQNKKSIVNYPQPREVYPQSDVQNYAIVMINKDKQSNIFPLNYPQSLEGFINKKDYTNKIIKINSYLIPTTRCLNYQSTLFIHYQLISSIFLLLLLTTVFLIFCKSNPISVAAILISTVVVCFLCYKVHSKHNSSKERGQISHCLAKCCKEWEIQQEQAQIKCSLSSQLDIILISFPIDAQLQQQQSLQAFGQPYNRQQNRQCSIKVPFSLNDVAIEGDSEGQDDKFWKDIERVYNNSLYQQHIILRQNTQLQRQENNVATKQVEIEQVQVRGKEGN